MVFGNRTINYDQDIRIHNSQITSVNTTQFLGVLNDEKLDWEKHINCVKSKLSRVVGVMYRASNNPRTTCLLTLYYSLFLLVQLLL